MNVCWYEHEQWKSLRVNQWDNTNKKKKQMEATNGKWNDKMKTKERTKRRFDSTDSNGDDDLLKKELKTCRITDLHTKPMSFIKTSYSNLFSFIYIMYMLYTPRTYGKYLPMNETTTKYLKRLFTRN